MTDPTTPTPNGQGTAIPVSPTPQEPTAAKQAEERAQEPKVVTEEALQKFGDDLLRRIKQSDKDRAKRINGEIENIKQRLGAADATLTPEQEAKLRNKISDELETEQEGQASPPSQMPAEIMAVMNSMGDLMESLGTEVSDSDPEFTKHIKPILDMPKLDTKALTKATVTAVLEKQAREQGQREKANVRSPGAGTPQLSGVVAKDAHELWNTAYKK